MNPDSNKLTLRERTHKRLAAPDTMELIEAHVANGGSILDLCSAWDVLFSDVHKWIYEDKIRTKLYEVANLGQNEWFIRRILQELNRISFIDSRKLFNSDGSIKPVDEWPDDIAHAVSNIDIAKAQHDKDGNETKPEIMKIKLESKLKAIEKLGNSKDLQLFTDRVAHSGKVTLLDLVEGSMQHAKDKSDDNKKI